MRAGALRHRLRVERPNPTRAASGAEIEGWTLVCEVWASIEPISGREALRANVQTVAEMNTRIRMRWSPAIDPMTAKWRLVKGMSIYDIKQITHRELRQREVEIMATSGVNRG